MLSSERRLSARHRLGHAWAVRLAVCWLALAAAGCAGASSPRIQPTPPELSAPTVEPTEQEAPTAEAMVRTARVGERALIGAAALTVTKVEITEGPESYRVEQGKTFVAVHVTLENVGDGPQTFDVSQFEFVDDAGNVYSDLENGNGSSAAFSADLFDYSELDPGGKVENKIILIQLDPAQVKGLALLFHADDENTLKVDLGL